VEAGDPEEGGIEMRNDWSFQRLLLKAVFGSLAAVLLLSGTAVFVKGSAAQDPVKTSYLLNLEMGQEWQTTLHVSNLEDQQSHIALTSRDSYGGLLGHGPTEQYLASRATQSRDAQKVLPPLTAVLKIESRGNYLVAATFQSLDGKKLEIIPAIQDTSNHLVFPLLFAGDHTFKKLTVLNVESTAANLEIIAVARDGSELQRIFFPALRPMASQTFEVERLFGSQTLEEMAAVRIISDKMLAGLQTVDPPKSDLVALPALTETRREWFFPVVFRGRTDELRAIVGIFNVDQLPASVTAEAFDTDHNSLGLIDRAVISPGATRRIITGNIKGGIPPETAFLKVSADRPVSGYEVISAKSDAGAAAITGISAEDWIAKRFELIGPLDGSALAIAQSADRNQRNAGSTKPLGATDAVHGSDSGPSDHALSDQTARAIATSACPAFSNYYDREIVDPVTTLLEGPAITKATETLSTGGTSVKGVAADGVARVVIRVRTGTRSSVAVTFSLLAADGATGTTGTPAEDGNLSTIDAQETSSSQVTVQSVQTAAGQTGFAIYNAPMDFVRNGTTDGAQACRDLGIAVRIGGAFLPLTLGIVRPPVFLIHGLWSSPRIWDDFPPLGTPSGNADSRFEVFRSDYSNVNSKPIYRIVGGSGGGVMVELNGWIATYKFQKKVAAVQADVVAHSLGGLIARAMPHYLPDRYFENATYRRGRIHKLITIDTPHEGSEFANLMTDALLRSARSTIDAFRFALVEELFYSWEYFRHNNPAFPKDGLTGGAVTDLQTTSRSPILGSLNNPEEIRFQPPVHTFIGTASPAQYAANQVLVSYFTDYLGEGRLGFVRVFGTQEHDLLVSKDSQNGRFAGASRATLRTDVTHSNDYIKARSVISRESGNPGFVINLLNASRDSDLFSPNGRQAPRRAAQQVSAEAQPTGERLATAAGLLADARQKADIARSQLTAQSGLKISAPADQSTVNAGQMITVKIDPQQGFVIGSVYLAAFGTLQLVTGPPFDFSVTVPDDAPLGPTNIMAIGVDSAGNMAVDASNNTLAASIEVNVSTTAALTSLKADYETVRHIALNGGEQPLYVTGFFSDGMARDITRASGTTTTSSNVGVAAIDSGAVRPVAPGTAIVTVSNSGQFDAVRVIVEVSCDVTLSPTSATAPSSGGCRYSRRKRTSWMWLDSSERRGVGHYNVGRQRQCERNCQLFRCGEPDYQPTQWYRHHRRPKLYNYTSWFGLQLFH
jgi:pimeloyl-ACP methyl ester carboxylesterase